ncbi:MAG: ArsR/SmtB family transcription factor [Candidatus Bathyarchaeia archaeon]
MNAVSVTNKELVRTAKFFKALGDETRLKILYLLEKGEKCQCDIVSYVGLSQPAVARHTQLLVDSGLLEIRKDGNKRYYKLTESARRMLFRIFEEEKATSQ